LSFDLRTAKTVFGFGLTRLRKYINYRFGGRDLESIFNYLQINPLLATSGQPSPHQFGAIARAGYKTVINLAPHNVENAVKDEASLVTDQGMQYINIPVDFKKPTRLDFQQFVGCMKRHRGEKIWVHCAANMRVSCFIFLYRTIILNEDYDDAQRDLRKIWTPSDQWKELLGDLSTFDQPT
jgi:protein tyrosine phosphatase (PTP) superfamily phosphohydrolase (DUF442 family)